jgi:hypothetical protein
MWLGVVMVGVVGQTVYINAAVLVMWLAVVMAGVAGQTVCINAVVSGVGVQCENHRNTPCT